MSVRVDNGEVRRRTSGSDADAGAASDGGAMFLVQTKAILRGNLEVMAAGGLDEPEGRNAVFKNHTLLLFLVFLMNNKDVELTDIVIEILDVMCRHPDGCDALLRTSNFSAGFRDLRDVRVARGAESRARLRRVLKALRRRGLGAGLDETPALDLSEHRIEYDGESKTVKVTVTAPSSAGSAAAPQPQPQQHPLRFLNTGAGTKSRLVTLKVDGILDRADKDDVRAILVGVPGVVSIYFDSKYEDRVNVRVLVSVSPLVLAKAVTTKGPYAVFLVVKRTKTAGGGGGSEENDEELVPLEVESRSWKDSYLPDETVLGVDDKAPAPASSGSSTGGGSGGSWSFLSSAARFIRRPFW